jgi:spore maturation protein B
VYSEFLSGVESGMKTVASIFAPLLGILTASAMLRESGLLSVLTHFLAPLTRAVHIPDGAVLLALMRPVSGGGSLGILSDIISAYGADSITALTAAVMMGSTETTLYTLCVYFKNTSVKHTRRILAAALLADAVCAAASGIVCSLWFG